MSKPKQFIQGWQSQRRVAFLRNRSQAKFRNESWTLTWEEYCLFWPTEQLFNQRGRLDHELVLTRKDPNLAWSIDNCHIITRGQQIYEMHRRRAINYSNKEKYGY